MLKYTIPNLQNSNGYSIRNFSKIDAEALKIIEADKAILLSILDGRKEAANNFYFREKGHIYYHGSSPAQPDDVQIIPNPFVSVSYQGKELQYNRANIEKLVVEINGINSTLEIKSDVSITNFFDGILEQLKKFFGLSDKKRSREEANIEVNDESAPCNKKYKIANHTNGFLAKKIEEKIIMEDDTADHRHSPN